MQYFGGKQRIAKKVCEYLSQWSDLPYLEPFVGSGAILQHIPNLDRTACDINESLIMLLDEVSKDQFIYPETISEEEYKKYKDDKNPSAMKAFVGFGCSFAGKWFGGYARSEKRNYAANASNSLRKITNYAKTASLSLSRKSVGFENVKFICKDYRELKPSGNLIYCDPPYQNTTGYSAAGKFDSDEFWDVMRKWSKDNIVIISEYIAPADFECVLEISTKTDIRDKEGKKSDRVERLFKAH